MPDLNLVLLNVKQVFYHREMAPPSKTKIGKGKATPRLQSPVKSVMRVVETQWSAQGDAVSVVKKNYSQILNAVEVHSTGEEESTRSDDGMLPDAFQLFSFLCFFGLWESVLLEPNNTQVYLQTKGLNIQYNNVA